PDDHFWYAKIIPSLFMMNVLPSTVPVVMPAPFHFIVRLAPVCVYVAVTSRWTSLPDSTEKVVLQLHVPSPPMVKKPDLTLMAAPSWVRLQGTGFWSMLTRVYIPAGLISLTV